MQAATKSRIVLYSIVGFFLSAFCLIMIPAPTGRRPSLQNRCINNLRQIEGAKQQWALEKEKPTNATPTINDLVEYLWRGTPTLEEVQTKMRCPSRGKLTIKQVWLAPTCSVTNHVLNQ